MLVYVNGQLLDSKKDDLVFLGFEKNEKEALLGNLSEGANTFAIYDDEKHNGEDIRLILQMMKKTLEERKNKTKSEK